MSHLLTPNAAALGHAVHSHPYPLPAGPPTFHSHLSTQSWSHGDALPYFQLETVNYLPVPTPNNTYSHSNWEAIRVPCDPGPKPVSVITCPRHLLIQMYWVTTRRCHVPTPKHFRYSKTATRSHRGCLWNFLTISLLASARAAIFVSASLPRVGLRITSPPSLANLRSPKPAATPGQGRNLRPRSNPTRSSYRGHANAAEGMRPQSAGYSLCSSTV